MQKFGIITSIGLGIFILLACSSTTTTKIPPQNTREPASFLLSEPGPYYAGNVEYTLIDDSRNDREIKLLIWYPALKQTDADGQAIVHDAMPDMSNAPYPLILTEEDSGRDLFMSHLATHGFVMIVVKSSLSLEDGGKNVFQVARDFLFSLEQISQNPPDGLKKVMDTDQVGVTGYSYGGDGTFAVSGARVDPEFYLSQCDNISSLAPEAVQLIYKDYYCQDASNWDEFVTFMGDEITHSDNGLWQPLTDERIRAVMPMAPTVSWFYGERGLASVDRPTLLIWGTKDVVSPYLLEAKYTFEHLIIPDRYLISFINWDHTLPASTYGALRIKHFATAFFGYYLQGRKDYSEYLSEEFVSQFDDLAWGAYSDK